MPPKKGSKRRASCSGSRKSKGAFKRPRLTLSAPATRRKNLYQIYVLTKTGRFLIYLDTTTQNLVYDPLVSSPDPTTNYSTIFRIDPAPHVQRAYTFSNYVTSGLALKRTAPQRHHDYKLSMEASTSQSTDYDVFCIQNRSRKPMDPRLIGQRQIVTISIPGEDIYWCPANEDSYVGGERRVHANKSVGHFQLKRLPGSFNVPPP